MSILYTLISRKTVVLTSFSNHVGNFEQLTLKILQKVENNKRTTYSYGKYYFHFIEKDNLIVMCMTDQSFSRGSSFFYLDDIRDCFLKEFTLQEIKNSFAHSLSSFDKTLNDKMIFYNSNKEEIDKIPLLEKGIINYSSEIIQASDLIEQERDGKLSILVKKADGLISDKVNFFQSGKKLKEKNKCKIIIISSLIIIILVCFINHY